VQGGGGRRREEAGWRILSRDRNRLATEPAGQHFSAGERQGIPLGRRGDGGRRTERRGYGLKGVAESARP
jgi:hypothetical protein